MGRDGTKYAIDSTRPGRTPQKCSAPQYVDHVMTWVEDQINKEDIFPTTPGKHKKEERGARHVVPRRSEPLRPPRPPPPSRTEKPSC